MCRMFLNNRRTMPGIARTFLNDCKRNSFGIAMNMATANNPNNNHHFSHHSGMTKVIIIEMHAKRTIKIERGIRACCIVLSMKLILP